MEAFNVVEFFASILFLVFGLYTLVNLPPTLNDPLIVTVIFLFVLSISMALLIHSL